MSTAWGSFARASNPVLRDVHEYITVWSKERFDLPSSRGRMSGIANQDFVDWTRSIWHFPTETKVDHPAPFPAEYCELAKARLKGLEGTEGTEGSEGKEGK